MSYFALSAQKGRWFFVLAHFAFLARAAMARQRMMWLLTSPAWVVPLKARLWEASHNRAYGKK